MSVRYVGFLAEDSGFGQAARAHLLALHDAGVTVHARSVRLDFESGRPHPTPPSCYARVRTLARRCGHFDTVLVHTPPMFFHLFTEPQLRNVGVTAFETQDLPKRWTQQLDAMDELWVPSTFCARAFSKYTRRPVRVVPHPVAPMATGPLALPGIPTDVFLFLSIFEWSDRKNPDGLLRAFKSAFSERDDVALLLKVGLRFEHDGSRILRAITSEFGRRLPHVYVSFDPLSPAFMQTLFRRADAYVSLHRAEGFGLTMAEAMAARKPVVATAYSGNMDFMDAQSAFLVDYRLVRIRERLTRTKIFDRRWYWAEPDSEAAVECLRSCVASPSRRQSCASRGSRMVEERLAPNVVGATMKTLLDVRARSTCGGVV